MLSEFFLFTQGQSTLNAIYLSHGTEKNFFLRPTNIGVIVGIGRQHICFEYFPTLCFALRLNFFYKLSFICRSFQLNSIYYP